MAALIYLLLMFLEIIILFCVSVYGVSLLFSSFQGAPYVPTSKKQLEAILKSANLIQGARFVELGSGDGRMVRYAVKKYGVTGVGVEINPLLVWWATLLSKRERTHKRVTFIAKNAFDYPLKEAQFLYIFLMPDLIKKLLPKFKKELKKGTVVVSHGFKIIGFEKLLTHTVPDKTFSTYYYKI